MPPIRLQTTRLLFFSAAWIFICLAGIHVFWVAGVVDRWDVALELLAAGPLAIWASLLWRGRFVEPGLRHIGSDANSLARAENSPADSAPGDRTADDSPPQKPLRFGRREIVLLFVLAALLRLVLLPLHPRQSDDLYRYLWEGRVQLAGENPFAHAPDSERLAPLRDDNWRLINHPEYSAIYPPLAQFVFAAAAAASPTVPAVKIAFTLCDLLLLYVLVRWLIRIGRSPAWATLWAFHPLVIVEFSGNGHLDSLMALALVLSFWLLDRAAPSPAAACEPASAEPTPASIGSRASLARELLPVLALTAAVAAKLIPLLLLPFFVWRLNRWWLVFLVPLAVALLYLPYAAAGEGVWASLWIYQRDWLYNAPVFEFIRDTLFREDGWLARYWFYGALLAIIFVLWFWRTGPVAAALPVLGFYQVAGPVVHPWYLCVFIPLICVRYGAWPWLWLTAAVPLVYIDESNPWIRGIVWLPFLAGLTIVAAQAVLSRTRFRIRRSH